MEDRKLRIFTKRIWMLRLYAAALVLMLALSVTMLLSHDASAADRASCRYTVTIRYHGQTMVATSSAETVQQLLQRLDLEVTGEDIVSHGMEEPVVSGMELRIERIVTAEESDTSVVSHSGTVAVECGGDIKGDRLDLYMPTYEQCMEFGRRVCTVYFPG